MADNTGIEWTRGDDGTPGATWNPTTGCDKVSAGCGLPRFEGDDTGGCYAMAMAKRLKAMGAPHWGDSGGDLAHPWYALYIDPAHIQVTGYQKRVRCSDRGCEHDRLIINGGLLTADPLRVILVSTPGDGHVWRRLDRPDWPAGACDRSGGG